MAGCLSVQGLMQPFLNVLQRRGPPFPLFSDGKDFGQVTKLTR